MAHATLSSDHLINPSRVDFAYIATLIAQSEQSGALNPVVIHYISDNAGDTTDTAPLEIVTRLEDINAFFEQQTGQRGPRVQYHNIPSQDTHAAAFDLAQAARGAVRGFGNVYFVNCAPRKKQAGVKKANGGEKIYVGILPNGAIIAGTGEDAFVHFKDLIEADQLNIYEANVQTNGSQFRSRDIFPYFSQILGWHIHQPEINRLWRKELNVEERDQILFTLGSVNPSIRLSADQIPDLHHKGAIIQRRDIHQNAKTALRHSDIRQAFRAYQEVIVYARGGEAIRAQIARASFEKKPGTTVVSAGSSGEWKGANGEILSRFAEIFTINGKAAKQLGLTDDLLKEGAEIHIIPVRLFDEAKERLLKDRNITDTAAAGILVDHELVDGIDYKPLHKELITARRRDISPRLQPLITIAA